ncbi:hypothetical protein HDU96_000170 [Phlyctochytrium bullatum]|nr:hypothetical protein HDU96_000170 [Phlyctochytrium bullatum]
MVSEGGRWIAIRAGRHHWENPPDAFADDPDGPHGTWQRNWHEGVPNNTNGAKELEANLIKATKMGNTIIFVRDRLAHTFFCDEADQMLLGMGIAHGDGPAVNFPPAVPEHPYEPVGYEPLGEFAFIENCKVEERVWRQLNRAVYENPTQVEAELGGLDPPSVYWAEHFSAREGGVMAWLRQMGAGPDMEENLDGIWAYHAAHGLSTLMESDVGTAVANARNHIGLQFVRLTEECIDLFLESRFPPNAPGIGAALTRTRRARLREFILNPRIVASDEEIHELRRNSMFLFRNENLDIGFRDSACLFLEPLLRLVTAAMRQVNEDYLEPAGPEWVDEETAKSRTKPWETWIHLCRRDKTGNVAQILLLAVRYLSHMLRVNSEREEGQMREGYRGGQILPLRTDHALKYFHFPWRALYSYAISRCAATTGFDPLFKQRQTSRPFRCRERIEKEEQRLAIAKFFGLHRKIPKISANGKFYRTGRVMTVEEARGSPYNQPAHAPGMLYPSAADEGPNPYQPAGQLLSLARVPCLPLARVAEVEDHEKRLDFWYDRKRQNILEWGALSDANAAVVPQLLRELDENYIDTREVYSFEDENEVQRPFVGLDPGQRKVSSQVETSMVELAIAHRQHIQPLVQAHEDAQQALQGDPGNQLLHLAAGAAEVELRDLRRDLRRERKDNVKEIRGSRFRHDNAVSWFERKLAARKARNAQMVREHRKFVHGENADDDAIEAREHVESDQLPDPEQSVNDNEAALRGRNTSFFGAPVEQMLEYNEQYNITGRKMVIHENKRQRRVNEVMPGETGRRPSTDLPIPQPMPVATHGRGFKGWAKGRGSVPYQRISRECAVQGATVLIAAERGTTVSMTRVQVPEMVVERTDTEELWEMQRRCAHSGHNEKHRMKLYCVIEEGGVQHYVPTNECEEANQNPMELRKNFRLRVAQGPDEDDEMLLPVLNDHREPRGGPHPLLPTHVVRDRDQQAADNLRGIGRYYVYSAGGRMEWNIAWAGYAAPSAEETSTVHASTAFQDPMESVRTKAVAVLSEESPVSPSANPTASIGAAIDDDDDPPPNWLERIKANQDTPDPALLGPKHGHGLKTYGRRASHAMSYSMSSLRSTGVHAAGAVKKIVEVKFEEKSEEYFKETEITDKTAGVIWQWAVIGSIQLSGATTAWNYVLEYGWGSVIGATFIATVFFTCFSVILVELMLMLPFSGGMATYSRAAFGPYIGYLVGTTEMWEYLLVTASNLAVVGDWLCEAVGISAKYSPIWWFAQLVLFLLLQIMGNKVFLNTLSVLTIIGVLSPVATSLALLPKFDAKRWGVDAFFASGDEVSDCAVALAAQVADAVNSTLADACGAVVNTTASALNETLTTEGYFGGSMMDALFPLGFWGVLKCLPSALLMYLGVEVIPLMVEESRDFIRESPHAVFWSQLITILVFWVVIVIQPGSPPGVLELSASDYPTMTTLFGTYSLDETAWYSRVMMLVLFVTTVVAGSMGLVYGYTRISYNLARGGYLPSFMSTTKMMFRKEQVPWAAMLMGCFIIVGVASIGYVEGKNIIEILGNSGTMYATIAFVTIASATAFVVLARSPEKRISLYICLGKIVFSFLIMYIFHRHHLVLSPEEAFIQEHINPHCAHTANPRVSTATHGSGRLSKGAPDADTGAMLGVADAADFVKRSNVSIGIGRPKLDALMEEGSMLEMDAEKQAE